MAKSQPDPKTLDLGTLAAVASARFEHFTLFSFSTHWKAMPSTPDLYGTGGRDEVKALMPYPTAEEALFALVSAKEDPNMD